MQTLMTIIQLLVTLTAVALYLQQKRKVKELQEGEKILNALIDMKDQSIQELKRIFLESSESSIIYTEDYSGVLNSSTIKGDQITLDVKELLDEKYIAIISNLFEANEFPENFQKKWSFDPENLTVSFSMLNHDGKNIFDSKSWLEFLEERGDFIKAIIAFIDNMIKELEDAIQSSKRLGVIHNALTPTEIPVKEKRAYTKKANI